jgi:AcrR family transcriptional regulator
MRQGRKRGGAADPEATRRALVDAATVLFARCGFEGTSVEEIARRARANKAMVSYHFGGKRGLYLEILASTVKQAAARMAPLLASPAPAGTLLREYIRTFAEVMSERPFIPPILIREMLEGGPHVDEHLLPHFVAIFSVVREIIERGVREGVFREAHPLLTHLSVVGSVVFFYLTAPMRQRLGAAGRLPVPNPSPEDLVAHVQELMAHGLAVKHEASTKGAT